MSRGTKTQKLSSEETETLLQGMSASWNEEAPSSGVCDLAFDNETEELSASEIGKTTFQNLLKESKTGGGPSLSSRTGLAAAASAQPIKHEPAEESKRGAEEGSPACQPLGAGQEERC